MDALNQYSENTNCESESVVKRGSAWRNNKHIQKKKKNELLKVVYISSPMKVKTSESKFRSLVQQLTGKDSQVAMFMEDNSNQNTGEARQTSVCEFETLEEQSAEDPNGHWCIRSEFKEEMMKFEMDENLMAGQGSGWEFDLAWNLLLD